MAVEFWDNEHANLPIGPLAANNRLLRDACDLFGELSGRRLLDLGCGTGAASLAFAELGADVVAVDNSSQAIDRLSQHCRVRGITNVRPICMNALEIGDLGPFDFVFGSFVLHHIEPFDRMAEVLSTSIKPGGKAFFLENSAELGRAAMFFRKHLTGKLWIPKYGDDEEFPLQRQEVDWLRRYFDVRVDYPELVLFRKISQYVFKGKVAPGMFAVLDKWGYRWGWMRRKSYHQYILLENQQSRSIRA